MLGRLVGFLKIQIQDRLRTIMRLSSPRHGGLQVDRLAVRDGLPPDWRLDVGSGLVLADVLPAIENGPGGAPGPSLEDYIQGQNDLKLETATMELEELVQASSNTEEALAMECARGKLDLTFISDLKTETILSMVAQPHFQQSVTNANLMPRGQCFRAAVGCSLTYHSMFAQAKHIHYRQSRP